MAGPASAQVVGGGPAGLEAARVLASRGLRVTLTERAPLGSVGCSAPPQRDRAGHDCRCSPIGSRRSVVDWGVEIRTAAEIEPDDVADGRSGDGALIVATGSRPRPAPCPVDAAMRVLTAAEVLSVPGWMRGRSSCSTGRRPGGGVRRTAAGGPRAGRHDRDADQLVGSRLAADGRSGGCEQTPAGRRCDGASCGSPDGRTAGRSAAAETASRVSASAYRARYWSTVRFRAERVCRQWARVR